MYCSDGVERNEDNDDTSETKAGGSTPEIEQGSETDVGEIVL